MKSSTTDRAREQFSGSIIVGKDILELLSSAMYIDPLSIYREYIQNSTDSIDEAETQCLYSGSTHPGIEITIDCSDRCIKIRDNGVGVQKHAIAKTLTSIGGSKKRGKRSRGFRGVGRLSGLGYCHELVMRTKAKCDSGREFFSVRI